MSKTKEKLNYFYLLKFIAAILIAIMLHYNDHLLPSLGLENTFNNKLVLFFMNKSYLLVELFFIMSGILFYISSREGILRNKKSFGEFITNKISKLLPIMIISCIYVYICNYILFKYHLPLWSSGSVSLFDLFLSFVQGKTILRGEVNINGPLWYINIYFVCITLAYYLTIKSKKYGDKVFLIPIIASLIMYYNFLEVIPIFSFLLIRGLSAFFIGIYVSKFLNFYNDFSNKKKFLSKTICFLFIIFFLHCYDIDRLFYFYSPEPFSYSLFVFTPLIIFLYDFKILNKLCSLKLIRFLGNISYGIYVWNFPILITIYILYLFDIIHYNVYSKLFLFLLLIIHIIVASISYFFIEKKSEKIKFNFIKKY